MGLACNVILMFMFGFYFKEGYSISVVDIEFALLWFNLIESYILLQLDYYLGHICSTAFKHGFVSHRYQSKLSVSKIVRRRRHTVVSAKV
jgi:hypothetical protein